MRNTYAYREVGDVAVEDVIGREESGAKVVGACNLVEAGSGNNALAWSAIQKRCDCADASIIHI